MTAVSLVLIALMAAVVGIKGLEETDTPPSWVNEWQIPGRGSREVSMWRRIRYDVFLLPGD